MTIKKYIAWTIIPLLILTSCNNSPDIISADNYYQLRKQLFHYKFIVDKTTDIKKNSVDFANDSLELLLKNEADNVALYIDTIKSYLIEHYKVKDPYSMTKDEIINYSFNDSLFAYTSLNQMFCGELGVKPDTKYNAYTLHTKVKDYFKSIGSLTGDKTSKYIFYPRDYEISDGVKITWQYQHFFKNNLITTLTNLEIRKQEIYLTFIDIKNNRRHEP